MRNIYLGALVKTQNIDIDLKIAAFSAPFQGAQQEVKLLLPQVMEVALVLTLLQINSQSF